jgi:gamma-glutamyltranspeptidase / glutathione hydrolase
MYTQISQSSFSARQVGFLTKVIFLFVFALFVGLAADLVVQAKATPKPWFRRGVVVAQNKLASDAGAEVLAKGGNAADAAFTTAYTLAVVSPNGSGLGGGGFALVYTKKSNTLTAIDFRERAPAGVNEVDYEFVEGPKAAGIPGTVRGLEYLQAKYGKINFKDLLQKPYEYASEGFLLNSAMSEAINKKREVLKKFTNSREVFLAQEQAVPKQVLVQKNLANTLKQIQLNGANSFYSGATAKELSQSIAQAGGIITEADLKNYQVHELEPVCGSYRGEYKVCSFPLPSSGGVCLLESLNILENFDLKSKPINSPERIHWVVEALKFSFADRSSKLGDPRFNKIDSASLLSKNRANYIAEIIKKEAKAIPSPSLIELLEKPPAVRPKKHVHEREETTHFTVVDKEGNIVVITTSLNGSLGSGFVAGKTGVLMNNTLDDFSIPASSNQYGLVGSDLNAPMPGKTPLSSMTPTIIFDKNNMPILALGSPGGPTIISAVLNVILAYFDGSKDLQEAVSAGRVHHQWMPDKVFAERELLDPNTQSALAHDYGYEFPQAHNSAWKRFYWSVQAAELNWQRRQIIGVSDPRTEEGLSYSK